MVEKDIVISEHRDVKILFKNEPEAPVFAWVFREIDGVPRLLPMTYLANKQGKGYILPINLVNDEKLSHPESIIGFKINGEIFEGLELKDDI